jgi:hypothetical protein
MTQASDQDNLKVIELGPRNINVCSAIGLVKDDNFAYPVFNAQNLDPSVNLETE